ncbi:MAG: hypothetical protein GWP17_00220 [Aquificales bacterium]|nr:hypothetical protein [Aquificales bacterium]
MGENWNKKRSVADNKPQWSVIIALLALVLLPVVGVAAIFYFFVHDAPLMVLFTIGGLCLFSLTLPLLALYFLRKSSKRDDAMRDGQVE